MKLIVGLGNPGKEYERTRHNIGFRVLDYYLGDVNWQLKDNYAFCKTIIGKETVFFLKPLTYMNNSGLAVQKFMNYFRIDDYNDILVIQDDLDQDFGKYKLKKKSSSGGHNGIKSIIKELGTDDFARLKIGINSTDKNDVIDFVLGKFNKSQMETLTSMMPKYKEIIDLFINKGIDITMNIYNTK